MPVSRASDGFDGSQELLGEGDSGGEWFEVADLGMDEVRPPSEYGVRPFSALPAGNPVWQYCRVSSRGQDGDPDGSHLDDQMAELWREAGAGGCPTVGVTAVVIPGKYLEDLAVASKRARECGAALIACGVSRLVRPLQFDPKENWAARPTKANLIGLQAAVAGVPVYTLVDPDAAAEVERAHESDRPKRVGHPCACGGGRRGRRVPGCKAWRKRALTPLVVALSGAGHRARSIARMTGISLSLVSDWLRSDDLGCGSQAG